MRRPVIPQLLSVTCSTEDANFPELSSKLHIMCGVFLNCILISFDFCSNDKQTEKDNDDQSVGLRGGSPIAG